MLRERPGPRTRLGLGLCALAEHFLLCVSTLEYHIHIQLLQIITMDRNESPRVDISRQRYPHSIVWGPLGPLTCCCPCVGHMGIGGKNCDRGKALASSHYPRSSRTPILCFLDSQGRIHDFAGPYCVNIDSFMVGGRFEQEMM
jgi:hypothetical protein